MTKNETPQIAVWYFVGATFIFIAPTMFFQGSAPLPVTTGTLVAGFIVVVLGGVQLGREIRQRRRDDAPPP